MSNPTPPPKAGYNLFDDEERVIEEAGALLASLDDAAPELKAGVKRLLDAYNRSVRQQRRLVKVSDRLQGQLTTAKAEAEEALDRLRETQETLVQAEKLASLGSLVAGVAHEINTPVGIALSCASHLADATTHMKALFEADDIGVEEFQRYMDTATDTAGLIVANCQRAAGLIGSFKQVAVDRTSAERRRFDLGAYLAEVLASLTPQLRSSGLEVKVDCPEGLEVDLYPGALGQVLTNFVMNSVAHGFEPGQKGTLRMDVTERPDGRLRLVYEDDGKGIPAEHLARIFDPFFTTRRGQGGSGLGLHVVYNLVTGPLEGTVAVDSTPGKGTRFTVEFPRAVG